MSDVEPEQEVGTVVNPETPEEVPAEEETTTEETPSAPEYPSPEDGGLEVPPA